MTEHESLPATIYRRLREAILSGNLRPGQVLKQEELAKQFNTSRVPLREALQHLQADGFVVLRPRRGYAVTALDSQEVLGILQLRMLIEGYAGYVATRTRTQADVRQIEATLREMEKFPSRDLTQAQIGRWLVLNRRFHDQLFAASRRPDVQQLASNMAAKIDPYIMLELNTTHDLVDGHHFHREIFEAFKAGDAARVSVLSRVHCELTARRFLSVLHGKGLLLEVSEQQVTDLGPAAALEAGGTVGLPDIVAAPPAATMPPKPRSRAPKTARSA
ncbi:GntR family transcriptional regulator [Zavarzinia compransoris]|uniref:GntR family transcriptional regulator n=1 Tax=Zavarzinia marina TaxID=2911065 RepID=UPI001F2FA735|nr:GntR family transcriptional regulator [Zavarzinia marina]MCF4167365.1 GntR family transcriptional regulator [Zavarzinia marina]